MSTRALFVHLLAWSTHNSSLCALRMPTTITTLCCLVSKGGAPAPGHLPTAVCWPCLGCHAGVDVGHHNCANGHGAGAQSHRRDLFWPLSHRRPRCHQPYRHLGQVRAHSATATAAVAVAIACGRDCVHTRTGLTRQAKTHSSSWCCVQQFCDCLFLRTIGTCTVPAKPVAAP